ncbi:cytochrome P450 monooxygenase [Annulohypoxylon truncatum]|uniref:cytochrome P450 monooxygenase n=1 Tax=Annulohypoxylon truncatum TaxID=327061 RepID=UPI002008D132|nr:cytochrome P450 monooxygenase [Annulohypoxylon truncatum]KAI1206483.1 cytochrome P450 monooxygenase [Annulohypoxylon truncatum]
MAPQLEIADLLVDKPSASSRLMILALCAVAGYFLWSVIYNLFLSPLRKVPGPILWAISPLPQALMQFSGRPHKKVLALHQKYGDAVRTGPRSVSFLNPLAWKEVYGHRKSGQPENLKDPGFFRDVSQAVIAADSENHSRMRRILAHGFSAQEMSKQEPMIRGYIDLLFERMREHSISGRPVDMAKWYNYTTFDVIGDLAFGESFGCLNSSSYHAWVAIIFDQFKQKQILLQIRRAYPTLESLISPLLLLFVADKIREHTQLTETKVAKRLSLGSNRHDFMDAMTSSDTDGKQKMTLKELHHNADLLIIAGSETTATTLCGVTYLLCTHRDVLDKLCKEVRSTFDTEAEITLLSAQRLRYMAAVIDEGMRIYPAAPASVPRLIHRGGEVVCGKYLPEETIVDIWHWSMYHNPSNFALSESFIPERWMGDPRFANDKKDAFQPFSTGARNCLGKNLAYAEMRLILARLVWNYDISLAEKQETDWMQNQRMFGLWEKPPLNIRLNPRKID